MLQDLPDLVLDLVWVYLSYEDILVLRSTCKRLKEFIDGKKFRKLNLFLKRPDHRQTLFFTNDPIGYSHSFYSNHLTIFDSPRFQEKFVNVQLMSICSSIDGYKPYSDMTKFDLGSLNCFSALRHCEINKMPELKGKLSLPELRIAVFYNLTQGLSSFDLDCPKLSAMKFRGCKPALAGGQLKHLEYQISSFLNSRGLLKRVKLDRLSTICLRSIENLIEFLSDLQTGQLSLPSLNQIHLKRCDWLEQLGALADLLEELKSNPRTQHIQFSFHKRLIASPDELRRIAGLIKTRFDLSVLDDHSLSFLNTNLDLYFLFSYIQDVCLKEDTELKEETIKCLQNNNIRTLKLGPHKVRFSALELWAKSCGSLRSLELFNQKITERRLKMLSKHLPRLEKIKIFAIKCETLKPLFKFPNLQFVILNFSPPKDELAWIFWNQTLENVEIRLEDSSTYLQRATTLPRIYKIITSYQKLKFDSLHDMIEHYYGY